MSIVATTAAIWGMSGPACEASKDAFAPEGVADQISLQTAQNRSNRTVGTTDTVRVIIADAGVPRVNIPVAFTPNRMDDGANVSADTVITNSRGEASIVWTYGRKPGAYQVSITVPENRSLLVRSSTDVIAGPLSKVVTPATVTLDMNATTPLTATTSDAFDNPVQGTVAWTSLNQTVATVSAAGVVTGRVAGTARIVATAGTGADTTVVTVRGVVSGIDIVAPSFTLTAGTTMQLTATVTGDPTAAVTWSSLNQGVATVDNTGKLSALAAGQARIVASAGTRADTATFTVTAATTTTLNISPSVQTSIKRLAAGTTESFQGLYAGDHEANGDKGIQGFVQYSFQNVPANATITSAKVSLLRSAGAEGNPQAFGTLYAERTAVAELNEGALSTSAVAVLAATEQFASVDITPLVQQARAAGQTSVWLRLRFTAVQNNNGATDYGVFSAGGLEIKY